MEKNKKTKYTKEQITFVLKQVEIGVPIEEENRILKRLVAELSLDKSMHQDVLSKKFRTCGVVNNSSVVNERNLTRLINLNQAT